MASLGGRTIQRPSMPLTTSQGPHIAAASASIVPPTFALSADATSPRTTCAQAVVIPHDGQRIPYHCTMVHGGNFNCRCVP